MKLKLSRNMIHKKNLKDNLSIIIGGSILIIWGIFVSGLPDSYVFSFFGFEPSNSVDQFEDMGIGDWTERMMNKIWIYFILFAINYLITMVGIIFTIFGVIRSSKERKIVTKKFLQE